MNTWILTPEKYLKEHEAKKLLKILEEKTIVATAKNQKKPIRDYMLIDLALSTGLRASELGSIKIKNLFVGKGEAVVLVAHGKADKSRLVYISEKIKKHLKDNLKWKKEVGEPVKPDS